MSPLDAPVRGSCVSRKLEAAGARFEAGRGFRVAAEVPGGTAATAAKLALVDLSPLPRVGFKGRGTINAMQGAGVSVEPVPNRAFRQAGGGLCLVLGPGEVMLLSGLGDDDGLVRRLGESWDLDRGGDFYLVPRASTHLWFRIVGSMSPAFFAKLCGVDLRPHKFGDRAIAQTSVAKLTGIIARDDIGGTLGFHLLADSASAEYLWDCLLDAMDEFGGRPAGLATLAQLTRPD